jgi:type I restriction enzyme S subunit
MNMPIPLAKFADFARYRKDFIEINDLETYKRARVQLHWRGIVVRDQLEGAAIKTKDQQVAHTGELLVAEIDAKVGGIGIVPPEVDGAIVSSHYFLFEIDEKKCLRRWLDYYIRSGALEDRVTARGSTNYAAIRPHHVLDFEIPLPPVDEQRRIVARIKELSAKLDEARELRHKGLELSEGLWESKARALFSDLAQDGSLPLKDLVTIRGGGTPSISNPFFWDGSIPWICPRDMKDRVITASADNITEEAIRSSSAKLLPSRSVLMVTRGMILAHTVPSGILGMPAAINQDMKALIPIEKLNPEYLCSAFWALNDELLAIVEKSTHDTRKLQTPKLLNFAIPVPPVSEQRRIVAYLDELRAKVVTLRHVQEETAEELNALLPSILSRAFSGEL